MKEKSSPGATLFAVSVAGFLMPFMLSGVGVALPSIGRDFGAKAVHLGLVEAGYMVSVSIFLLAAGRLGDIHGRRRIFQLGLVLFTLVAGLISISTSMEMVIALRVMQGLGGAMCSATGPAIIVSVFPPEKRGRALGLSVAAIYAGLSLGPSLGGFMVHHFGWRSLFYLVVALGLTVYSITLWKLKGEWAESRGEPFDWKGSFIYGLSLAALSFGSANLEKGHWFFALIAVGLVGLGLFVLFEARAEYPVLNVGLLTKNRVFALSNLAALLNYAATFGVSFYLSLFLQYVKGMSPRDAGLVLVAQPAAQMVLSPFCGRLADKLPAAKVSTLGMAVGAAGLFYASRISEATSIPEITLVLCLLGVGFALFSSPNQSVIMGSVEPKFLGVASGVSSSMRSLGMMTSMTAITIILSLYMGDQPVSEATRAPFVASMRVALVVFAFTCALGVFLSLGRLKRGGAQGL